MIRPPLALCLALVYGVSAIAGALVQEKAGAKPATAKARALDEFRSLAPKFKSMYKPSYRCELECRYARVAFSVGEANRAFEALARAESLAKEVPTEDERAHIDILLALAYFDCGAADRSEPHRRKATEHFAKLSEKNESRSDLIDLACQDARVGDSAGAFAILEKVADRMKAQGLVEGLPEFYIRLAAVFRKTGDDRRASELVARSESLPLVDPGSRSATLEVLVEQLLLHGFESNIPEVLARADYASESLEMIGWVAAKLDPPATPRRLDLLEKLRGAILKREAELRSRGAGAGPADPDFIRPLGATAAAEARFGREAQALELLEKAPAQASTIATEAAVQVALILHAQGKAESAVRLLSAYAAREANEDQPDAHSALAIAYAKIGKLGEAERELGAVGKPADAALAALRISRDRAELVNSYLLPAARAQAALARAQAEAGAKAEATRSARAALRFLDSPTFEYVASVHDYDTLIDDCAAALYLSESVDSALKVILRLRDDLAADQARSRLISVCARKGDVKAIDMIIIDLGENAPYFFSEAFAREIKTAGAEATSAWAAKLKDPDARLRGLLLCAEAG